MYICMGSFLPETQKQEKSSSYRESEKVKKRKLMVKRRCDWGGFTTRALDRRDSKEKLKTARRKAGRQDLRTLLWTLY